MGRKGKQYIKKIRNQCMFLYYKISGCITIITDSTRVLPKWSTMFFVFPLNWPLKKDRTTLKNGICLRKLNTKKGSWGDSYPFSRLFKGFLSLRVPYPFVTMLRKFLMFSIWKEIGNQKKETKGFLSFLKAVLH